MIGLKGGYENEVINLGVLFHKDADAYPSDVLSAVLAPKGRLERAHPTDGRTDGRTSGRGGEVSPKAPLTNGRLIPLPAVWQKKGHH